MDNETITTEKHWKLEALERQRYNYSPQPWLFLLWFLGSTIVIAILMVVAEVIK